MFKGLRQIRLMMIAILIAGNSAYAQSEGDYLRAQLALKLVQENLRLDEKDLKFKVVKTTETEENGRLLRKVSLNHPEAGTANILINAPRDFDKADKRFPVIFITAGFVTGSNAIRFLPTRDDLILIGFDYPTTPEEIQKDPSLLTKAIRIIPGQMALTLEWLKEQSWTNPYSIHPVGVSLGSLFLPISLKLAEARGFIPRSTSLMFGGAHLQPVLETLIGGNVPPQVAKPTIDLILSVTAPYDPKMYLPLLRGPFLHVFGSDDNIFPRSTSVMQFVLLPQPKESHEIQGVHIDPSQPQIVKEAAEIFLRFLEKNL